MVNGKSTARPGSNGKSVRRELVVAQIYEQAARLFAERGYAGTTPQDIADAVGVSRQSLYYYVSSKEEILANLVAEMTEKGVETLRALVETDAPAPEVLYRIAHHTIVDRAANRTRFRLLDRSEAALSEELSQRFREGRRTVLTLVTEVIERGRAEGHFRTANPKTSALAVLGMCNWVAWWFEPGPDHPVEAIAAQLSEHAVTMLRAPAGADAPNADAQSVIDAMQVGLDTLRQLLPDRVD
ncbi:TetR/AcrR family transcriptional regulator [Nocardia sp. FBN12]|uniref:TetR/AcrR family transcriptional regulator n=1 Tax=Nocardia sp. FBN12 TaxID=3419766 RepID=UPI003D02CE1D